MTGHVIGFSRADTSFRLRTLVVSGFKQVGDLKLWGGQDRTDTISNSRLKPCLDQSALPVEPHRHGRPPGLPKAVTFRWPPVALPLTRLAVPAAPSTPTSLPGPLPVLAAARRTSPGWGPEPFFLPSARGFLYAQAPPRRSGPLHRPGGRNKIAGHRSGFTWLQLWERRVVAAQQIQF
jgi:hypothetical protein